jgi:hypothetical protein
VAAKRCSRRAAFDTSPNGRSQRGSLIVTAALELSRNQIIHFYSDRKNTAETCKLIDQLRRQYKAYRRIYLSWDAAPWHSSEQLLNRVEFLNGWAKHDKAPLIEILPLPAQAQFLNVIESVFSGMARQLSTTATMPLQSRPKQRLRVISKTGTGHSPLPHDAPAVRSGDKSECLLRSR